MDFPCDNGDEICYSRSPPKQLAAPSCAIPTVGKTAQTSMRPARKPNRCRHPAIGTKRHPAGRKNPATQHGIRTELRPIRNRAAGETNHQPPADAKCHATNHSGAPVAWCGHPTPGLLTKIALRTEVRPHLISLDSARVHLTRPTPTRNRDPRTRQEARDFQGILQAPANQTGILRAHIRRAQGDDM